LRILKYDANKDTIIKNKERNLVEEEEEMKTPLPLAFEDGEDLESMDEKSCGSCIQIIVKS
jgi:hypothetical protein